MGISAYLRATYEDGFVLIEDEADQSPYDEGRNLFHAIANSRPCIEHGSLQQLDLIVDDKVYSIDWTELPAGSVPVRDKHMEQQQIDGVLQDAVITSIEFGYRWTEDGKKIKLVIEVP